MSSPNGADNSPPPSPPPTAAAAAAAAPAAASAAAASSTFDDATIAQVIHAVDSLTTIFGFDAEVAQQAVEAVGTDVTTAYNYILDAGLGSDGGGPVVPIDNCPHVQYHVRLTPDQLPPVNSRCSYQHQPKPHQHTTTAGGNDSASRSAGLKEDTSGEPCNSTENWICLECGVVRCSRYVHGHGVQHYEDTLEGDHDKGPDGAGHCIAVSLSDLSVWCHVCRAYLKDPRLDPLVKKLEELKFGPSQDDPDNHEKGGSDNNNDGQADGDGHNVENPDGNHHGGNVEQNKDYEAKNESSNNSSNKNAGGHEDPQHEHESTTHDPPSEPARGVPIVFTDSDDDDDDDDERKKDYKEDEEEQVQYPFGSCPSSMKEVAAFIKSDHCKSIIILAGAGMSVASGIPDFRSSGGLYDTLDPDLLTASEMERDAIRMDPTIALNQQLFLQNPLPCLEVNRPFILGTRKREWKATLAHRFVELLHSKTGKLTRLYQQNIDGLEGQLSQLPRDKVVMVHGSMDQAECAMCGNTSDFERFCDRVQESIKDITGQDSTAPLQSKAIDCDICGYDSMKPSIVLFRSALPREFFEKAQRDLPDVDMLIVIGTSLEVAPANSLVFRVPKTALRMMVNREPVGFRLGIDYNDDAKRDYFARGNCEDVLLELMNELGWADDLRPLVENGMLPESSTQLLQSCFSDATQTNEATANHPGRVDGNEKSEHSLG